MDLKLLSRSLLIFFLVGLAAAVRGFGQTGHSRTFDVAEDSALIRRLADTILTDGKTYGNLRMLTKIVGARLSGSAGFYKGEQWGQRALEDALAGKVWLQECMVPHWVRGGKDSAMWSVGAVNGVRSGKLEVLALGNSVGTGPAGIQAPVLLIHDFDELERRKNEVKGRIVFYNYKFNPLFVETFRAYGDAVRYRVMGPSQAAKYGALAVLVRSMSSSVDNNPHTGALIYNDSFPKIPAAAVGLQDADRLAQVADERHPGGGSVRVYLRTNAQMLPDTLAHNVIGELRGSEFPDEYITVGGHLDSWDPAEGAQDDGAGCVQSIEVLRALKAIGYKPRHTIRVVLFANEENGGRGGRAYAETAKAKGEKHILGLESDNGGFTPRAFTLSLSEEKLAAIRPWLQLLTPYGVYEFVKGGGGSDVSPLGPQLGAVVGELRPDSQRYFDYHHSRGDVLENVNKRELELGAVNMAALIYLVDKYGL
ncbi:M20/M25/M40 family metallo-hydrolase [Puia dinghuensis]|uniref:Carboxypeptidase Q n=1 Tax=Puia dinghuensis TaxID=1792502 RepID=A0A8J2UJ66_9BACT|nr:M20/M25/M40 family metallo-hydrolase [Puia dinghuensis]GGB24548.1 peptidase M28 [Puia dinghuensis]